ncbi:MAG: hypothetical protein DMD54_05225 [Gemmatimonadetes bacterium]|nr:MAG: hypothetical protein DMD54_05225 [Gemmatimonadota bacterium]
MPNTGGEAGDSSLPFDPHPGDAGPRQRVECVTFEHRATGREHDDERLVLHLVHARMLWTAG